MRVRLLAVLAAALTLSAAWGVTRAAEASGAPVLGGAAVVDETLRAWDIVFDAGEVDRAPMQALVAPWREEIGPRASRTRLERLARQLSVAGLEVLAAEGWFAARIDAQVEALDVDERWRVQVRISGGTRARVTAVDLQFDGAVAAIDEPDIAARDEARGAFNLAPGAPFRSVDWEAAKQSVLRRLQARRFPAARIVSSRADVDPASGEVDLQVRFDSGPEYRFGALRIPDLERVNPVVVERMNRIRAGDVYTQAALVELQTRLQQSQYFAFVNVSVDPDPADPQALPIDVQVTAAQHYLLETGVGYSTDSGPRASLQYEDRAIFGSDVQWRNLFRLDAHEQTASSELRGPVDEQGWQLALRAGVGFQDYSRLAVHAQTVTLERSKSEGRIERVVSVQAVRSNESPDGADAALKRALAPGYAWRYRDFDNPLDPRRGLELTARLSGGARAAGSDANFVRSFGRVVSVRPIGGDNSLVLRAEAGAVSAPSRDHVPAEFLFRIGGDQSLRGYRYMSIGPREGNAVVGGRYEAIVGAEWIHWVSPGLGVAAFHERGDAVERTADFRWNAAWGLGVRWRSGIGPINADIAWGESVNAVRLHLSLGFLF
jgi:translocation and assembly module TamA